MYIETCKSKNSVAKIMWYNRVMIDECGERLFFVQFQDYFS